MKNIWNGLRLDQGNMILDVAVEGYNLAHDCADWSVLVLEEDGSLKSTSMADCRLSEDSVMELRRRLAASRGDETDIQPPCWGYVSILGHQSIVGSLRELPGGEVHIIEYDTMRHFRIPRQARHTMETNLTVQQAHRLHQHNLNRGYIELNNARRIIMGEQDIPKVLLGQEVELHSSLERWCVVGLDDDTVWIRSQNGVKMAVMRIDWTKEVHTVHRDFPPPIKGVRVRWDPGEDRYQGDEEYKLIEGTLIGVADQEYVRRGHGTVSIPTRTVYVFDTGQTMIKGNWGYTAGSDFWEWDVLEMPEGWPEQSEELPQLPLIVLPAEKPAGMSSDPDDTLP